MGIWDYFSSTTEAISGGVARSREIIGGAAGKTTAVTPYLSGAWQSTRHFARVASESAVWSRQVVVLRMPDREQLERIGRLGLRIADHAIDHGTKPYTFGIPVYKFMKEELLNTKSHVQPVKEEKENAEFAILKAKIEYLEKENMELQELKPRMDSLEKKLVEINHHNGLNQKVEKRPKYRDWCPPELIDLIKIE